LSVSKYAKEVTPRRPTNKVVRTHDHRRRIRLPIDRFPWLKHAEIASELFDIISQGWDMRPQVNNVEITKKLAGDRIVSREIKLFHSGKAALIRRISSSTGTGAFVLGVSVTSASWLHPAP
jgi:hypothetical protein